MQPWQELARGPLLASKNLFLDYISPHPVISFLSSLKRQHWPVSAVLLGSIFFKLSIVLSTGLFASLYSNIPIPVHVDMIEQFKLDGFNATTVDDTAGSIYTSLLLKQIDFPRGSNVQMQTLQSSYSNPQCQM
jgi:hypothetical protein